MMMIRVVQFILLVVSVSIAPAWAQVDEDSSASSSSSLSSCPSLVDSFETKYRAVPVSTHDSRPRNIEPFVFFLHVPRTAGKTYSSCFLSPSVPPSETCLPGYDRYRLPSSPDKCRYYSSHDDLSLVDQLSEKDRKRVEVVTQLRDPVSRVMSAYEFPIEVAARKVRSPISVIEKAKKNQTTVNTYNVWPWNYLTLHARDAIEERLLAIDERGGAPVWERYKDEKTGRPYFYNPKTNETVWNLPDPNEVLDPYDNELTMSLREWIETPEAEDLVHNGHTLQLLGISNTSFWEEARALRTCFFRDETSRERLFELAKEKLRAMPHAGLQERLGESVVSLAASLGRKMSDVAYKGVQLKYYIFDERSNPPNWNERIEYVSTVMKGPQKLPLFNARLIYYKLHEEMVRLEHKLKKQEPKLKALLEKEEAWMDAKERERDSSKYWQWRRKFIEPIYIRAKWALFAAKSAVKLDFDALDDFDWYNDMEQEGLLKESPYGANITSLDDEVAMMQRRRDDLNTEIDSLNMFPSVVGVEWTPTTKAFVPFPDDELKRKDRNLGIAYSTCSRDAYDKGKKAHEKPMKDLRNERGEGFSFSSELRKAFLANKENERLVDRIRELNSIDQRLIEYATELFEETFERQRAAGKIEKIPPPLPKKDDAPRAPRRGPGAGDAPAHTGRRSTTKLPEVAQEDEDVIIEAHTEL